MTVSKRWDLPHIGGNKLNPVPESRVDGNGTVMNVGNVESVQRIEDKPAQNLRDELGSIFDPDNYEGSLGDTFGNQDRMSFEYLGNLRVNKGRR